MDENSFDPKSWTKAPGLPAGLHNDDKSTTRDAPNPVQGPVVPPAPPAADRARYVPFILSGAILLAGAGAAWLTRTNVPTISATPVAAASAAPVPGVTQRRLVLANVGDIAGALTGAGVSPADAQAAGVAAAKVLSAPGEVHAVIDLLPQNGAITLQRLQASYADGSGAVVSGDGAGHFSGSAVTAELTHKITVLRGELDSDSFYTSAVTAGLIDTLIPEFINAFSYDFNIASEVAPGDTFEVAYEQSVDAGGTPVGQPHLLFGSLTTKTKSLALYRFQEQGGEVAWYDGNGASTKRGIMRTPVDGARITSKFGMRFHPVLMYNKMHKGTDFAAPIGTPIYAAKDGTVLWAAMKGPNGNLTILQHDKDMQTYYLHQSMFMPGVVAGAHVTQGQKIGEIGTTGRSTGPHLHFELHVHNEPIDPLSMPSDDAQRKKLAGPVLAAFITQRNRIDVARAGKAG